MATTNKNFKVKNGLDVNSNATVDSSGNANVSGNITANSGYVSADTFRLDTSYSGGSAVVGEFSWDPDNETARLLLNGVNLQIGQEHVIRVKNSDGANVIPDRTAVMVTGATGDTVIVAPAVASNVATYPSDYFIGITTEEIPADGFGFVTQFGFINQVNTAAWTVGTLLYVDPATPGGLTSTQPAAPAWQTRIAAVTKQNASSGRLLVRAAAGVEINQVEGVEISSPADNEVLAYNSADGTWINQTPSEAGLAALSGATFTGNVAGTNVSATGVVSGLELTSTQSSGSEGGQINLAKPATTSLSGNIIVDVYNNQLRFFDSSSTKGAYIDLTAAGSSVGTNLLGGVTGAMNYAQEQSAKVTGVSSNATTIISKSFTTNGYPVQVMVTGDAENNTAGAWVKLQLFRDSTAIGKIIHVEMSAGSENSPYALTVVDAPAAGTYTYSLKTVSSVAAGVMNFGETDGPVLTLIELSGPKGDTGAAGAAGNSFETISANGTSVVADSSTDTLTLTPSNGITITGNATSDTITISTNASDANGASTIVARDASGNFAANQAQIVSQKFGTGTGAPSFDAYTGGVRTIYYDNIGASSAGYAVGINSGEFWHTLSDTTGSYKWYGGITLAAELTGTGTFTTTNVNATTVSATTLVGNTNASTITTGTIANARTTATSAANASTIVVRDTYGSFDANVVFATTLVGTIDGGSA